MFASSSGSRANRRGIVLVVVLGMLGLMALIGVTFATFAGQSLIASRNFGQGVARPQSEALMDFALAQLINDTNNPLSAIRGHSLLRDMYGNDSVFRGASPTVNTAADFGGVLASVNTGGGPTRLYFTGVVPRVSSTASPLPTPFYNQLQYTTNIPTTGQYYGLDFTRWIVRVNYGSVPQSFEVLEDDTTSSNVHLLTLNGNLANPTFDNSYNTAPLVSGDWTSFIYFDPNNGFNPLTGNPVAPDRTAGTPPFAYTKPFTTLTKEPNSQAGLSNVNFPFVLDGRYMRAFNGPGLTGPDTSANGVYPYNNAAYANFRIISHDPDSFGMDEDYDACDLENWFLAIQSADGQIVIPSFHRPGILMAADWSASATAAQRAKILRPRQIDNSPLFSPDPLPDPNLGTINYDIDNDGDGITDSVWVDLGYPIQRDPGGKLYKPLFAFMVLGLNGRLPLNTVGNLQARAIGDTTNVTGAGEEPALGASTLSPSHAPPPTAPAPFATTQVAYAGPSTPTATPDTSYFRLNDSGIAGTQYTSQTFLDAPLWDHASHLGYSVNEINPKFALQNAPSNLYPAGSQNSYGGYTLYNNGTGQFIANNGNNQTFYSQFDNAGVSVALTQMRNILAGTVPTDITNPLSTSSLTNSGTVNFGSFTNNPTPVNNDSNIVVVNGQPWVLPNNVADFSDNVNLVNNVPVVARSGTASAGRWGETPGIPQLLHFPSTSPVFGSLTYPSYWYHNPVRAGQSFYSGSATDAMDDDFDALDPPFSMLSYGMQHLYYNSPPAATSAIQIAMGRYYPEQYDFFDPTGQMAIASERMRRYVIPADPAGVGRIMAFPSTTGPMTTKARPRHDYDYGNGYDSKGRVAYFRYFRPAGMPQEIRYPYGGYSLSSGVFTGSTYPNVAYSPLLPGSISERVIGQQYLMPQLYPVGQLGGLAFVNRPDIHNNRFHGYQSMLTPNLTTTVTADQIAVMGAMPYDWNPFNPPTGSPLMSTAVTSPTTIVGDVPVGYAAQVPLYSPLANPFNSTDQINNPYFISAQPTLPSSASTSNGPNLGLMANPASPAATYPIPYAAYGTNNEPYSNGQVTPQIPGAQVVNGYLGGSLNKDEADEMNLYSTNRYDMPYGPSDLEWLYRLQDVDGSTLSSRLAKLAPISFLNPADGLTRRRLFSTDSWELNNIIWANDNPVPYAGVLGNPMYVNGILNNASGNMSTDHDFTYNSRFTSIANSNLQGMNQVASVSLANPYANFITTEFLPNPTLPPQQYTVKSLLNPPLVAVGNTINEYFPNSSYLPPSGTNPIQLPLALDPSKSGLNMFTTNGFTNSTLYSSGAINSQAAGSSEQVPTPSLAHRDRKINLNHPVPVSNDPAEPIRQKWCRETYQMLKAILPPASVDTPEELAALSQFVVNILDFRDPDCTCTRFVNTDLEVTDALTTTLNPTSPNTGSAASPALDQHWNVSTTGVRFAQNPLPGGHFPYDPSLYSPDTTTQFLVQHGMEYSPIAISEVMGYQTQYFDTNLQMPANNRRLFVEIVNTLTNDQNGTNSDIPLNGWDMVVTPDSFGWGRPDPITGEVSQVAFPPLNPALSATTPPVPNPPLTTGVNPFNPTSPALPLPAGSNQRQPVGIQSTLNSTMISELGYVGWAPMPRVSVPAIGSTGSSSNYFLLANVNNPIPLDATGKTTLNVNGTNGTSSKDAENDPISPGGPTSGPGFINGVIPDTILPTPSAMTATPKNETLPTGSGSAMMFWVYLRRPANPFDNAPLTPERPNREMVVVDAMRFVFIEAGGVVSAGSPAANKKGTNSLYSLERLQPFRGGHLVPTDTPAYVSSIVGNTATTINGGTIFQQRPASAYGYSEQSVPITTPATLSNSPANQPGWFTVAGAYPAKGQTGGTFVPLSPAAFTYNLDQDPASDAVPNDSKWSHVPFHDRDFASVAELLLVPGCPPGLFTKQFVEESYPGNVASVTYSTSTASPPVVTATVTYATGYDDRIVSPAPTTGPGQYFQPGAVKVPTAPNMGRVDFPNQYANIYVAPTAPATATPPIPPTASPLPTYPYLPDSFYYSAASVAPPASGNNGGFTQLPTEIGGWTGAGWYKMFEFFDVPSSANGAIGTADQGNNYDWYRADVKPGLLNLNLIIDEEVFAGLVDDPRLNESLASLSSRLPFVVTQISPTSVANGTLAGYPDYNPTTGQIFGRYPIFPLANQSALPTTNGGQTLASTGRGYVVRDANGYDYLSPPANAANPFPYQQVHGLKAAFSDFLKLRHGGSGYLFAYGGGGTGSGNFLAQVPITNTGLATPVAAERPFRSLSYPDINYTIMRPASLPPSANVSLSTSTSSYNPPFYNPAPTYMPGPPPTTSVPLTTYVMQGGTVGSDAISVSNLANLFTYQTSTHYPFIQLNPAVAPMDTGWTPTSPVTLAGNYPYIGDPGIKNPFNPIQYVNQFSPVDPPNLTATPPHPGTLQLAPPYPNPNATTPAGQTSQAPFPPPIPPVPPRRLIQIPDIDVASGASLQGQINPASNAKPVDPTSPELASQSMQPFTVNQPAIDTNLSTMNDYLSATSVPPLTNFFASPPSLVDSIRFVFAPDGYVPVYNPSITTLSGTAVKANNYLGVGAGGFSPVVVSGRDDRQHPLYRTEFLQKMMNLTTVRTHQFAVWITVGFFEVSRPGTPELGIPDVLGQELGLTQGKNTRYRSFFTLDRTKATGFNPYYPGNFRDCVTYRRRIE